MALAVLGRILIVDFPDKVYKSRMPFLKPIEVKAIQDKLERDRRDSQFDKLTWPKFAQACKRWELWAFAIKFFAVTTIVYALAYFIPIILQGMGYDIGMVFLLAAPPAVAAVPWIMFCSWAADKWKLRAPFIILQAVLGIVGLMIVAYASSNGARYFGIFMGLAGANANIPTVLAWQANNIRGQSLRMYVPPSHLSIFLFYILTGRDLGSHLVFKSALALSVASTLQPSSWNMKLRTTELVFGP